MITPVPGAITVQWLVFPAVLLVVALVLTLGVLWIMAWGILRPPRMTDGKAAWVLKRLSPGDLNLKFEDVEFVVRDERSGRPLRIVGWWIPASGASDQTVVLLHGYADAKVGAIAWAPLWHDLGLNVLAIDLRAHGQSGGSESTAGFFERHDVAQVIGKLRAERPAQTGHVVLFGASMGATVAAATAAQGDAGPLAAVVLESPFADFRTASMFHMDALGAPGALFQRAALRLAEWMSGARFDDLRMTELLKRAPCPVLLIVPAEDGFSSASETAAMEAAVAARPAGLGVARAWKVEAGHHLTAVQEQPKAYRQRLADFLAEAVPSGEAVGFTSSQSV
jgi:pimeloyl-ACP methyl ester carboxylesterase